MITISINNLAKKQTIVQSPCSKAKAIKDITVMIIAHVALLSLSMCTCVYWMGFMYLLTCCTYLLLYAKEPKQV